MNPPFQYIVKEFKVVDGDTIDLTIDLGFYCITKQRFRLARINTEETNSSDPIKRAKGNDAKIFLDEYLNRSKCITVTSIKTEKYGRWLAEIFADGQNINDILVRYGLANSYDGGKR